MRMTEEEYARKTGKPRPRVKGIIRQSSAPEMNGTEHRFVVDHLRPMMARGRIASWKNHHITLKLANGVRYTPDFSTVDANGVIEFWEVKGAFVRDDSIVKIKMAPTIYPEHRFYLCQWTKTDGWTIQEVRA